MYESSNASLAARPTNVPPELVVDFDIFNLPGHEVDLQLAYRAFQQARPDIFWTPHNGGHWVATRAEDIELMQADFARFSNRHVAVPKVTALPPSIPLEIDPPAHMAYRKPLMAALMPKIVNGMEAGIRSTIVALIDGFQARGHCEFVSEFAQILPVVVFLDLVDLPHEDRLTLAPIAEMSVRGSTEKDRIESAGAIRAYLEPVVLRRREQPGIDLLSKIVNADIDGEKIPLADALTFATLVLFGGLDTIASMLGFITRFLALNPGHRRALVERLDDENFKRMAIEELLRRHGVANTARLITHDFDYKGLHFRAGEMILPPNMLVGLDDRKVSDPLTVDFNRPLPNPHAIFGIGAHTCPGAVLARREIKLFLEEWLSRIPDFNVAPGTRPETACGMVNAIVKLDLVWPRGASE